MQVNCRRAKMMTMTTKVLFVSDSLLIYWFLIECINYRNRYRIIK